MLVIARCPLRREPHRRRSCVEHREADRPRGGAPGGVGRIRSPLLPRHADRDARRAWNDHIDVPAVRPGIDDPHPRWRSELDVARAGPTRADSRTSWVSYSGLSFPPWTRSFVVTCTSAVWPGSHGARLCADPLDGSKIAAAASPVATRVVFTKLSAGRAAPLDGAVVEDPDAPALLNIPRRPSARGPAVPGLTDLDVPAEGLLMGAATCFDEIPTPPPTAQAGCTRAASESSSTPRGREARGRA